MSSTVSRLGTISTVIALVGLAAGIGYNYRQVTEVKEWQEKYDKEYVRRDVQDQVLKSINYQLEELRGQVVELKVLMGRKPERK